MGFDGSGRSHHPHAWPAGRSEAEVVIYALSKMENLPHDNLLIDDKQYCIYRDAACHLRPCMCTVYPAAR